MDVQATTATAAAQATPALQPQVLDKNDFLRLLVNQVKNQDPLNPMSNEEFVGQLTQFGILEQNQNLNTTVAGLTRQSSLQYAASLTGREVTWLDGGHQSSGRVDSVTFLEDGEPLLGIGGESVPLSSVIRIAAAPVTPTESPVSES